MISTMDTISGGRMELGIGAGWKRDEWRPTATASPRPSERLARLADDLGVITRCSRATSTSTRRSRASIARSANARNVPKPIQQPRVPIMVGGNGPNVTWRLAAAHADELNLDGMEPGGGRRRSADDPPAV
jgi:alkanesulfonate monooxygenase SsuD/methylene tetrahydromethanopterin reductase-like flavin-dependent oxidoreductase (luciferase family)